ncbi:hypothetical protein [Aestuariicoccus sp. MJ-SS9]|uniref:hypothetical protein n=1 Tax=Aestuariicoccus sp. MJ-SS9 TaxID=3079855 RepID=UPI00291596AE|nr:hypothetical protein [Aestuariicoccus sp. MJ-SS9]MDU8912454.1 hypothetical protein [Aestuariicoccus sp. MJ-SS9]
MSLMRIAIVLAVMAWVGGAASAQTMTTQNGTDRFIAGDAVLETYDAPGDVFVAGRSAVARGTASGDLHIAGMDVSVGAATGQDVYAMGMTVVLQGAIGEDLSATGMTLRTEPGAEIGGNARLLGGSVTIEGPIAGALTVTGQDVFLNAPVAGDARILAETLRFGPEARVGGMLRYSSERRIDVPESVAPADRVLFEDLPEFSEWDDWDEMRRLHEMPSLPGFASLVFGFVISLLFFVALGAIVLGFMPDRLEQMRGRTAQEPGQTLVIGLIGLSVLFGMVPVSGLTVVGLPFVPVVLLGIVVAWTLGYGLGAYTVAMRLWSGFGGDPAPGNIQRLAIFAAAIIAIALLNFIPFVGWVANYTLVLLGIGAMTRAVFGAVARTGQPATEQI